MIWNHGSYLNFSIRCRNWILWSSDDQNSWSSSLRSSALHFNFIALKSKKIYLKVFPWNDKLFKDNEAIVWTNCPCYIDNQSGPLNTFTNSNFFPILTFTRDEHYKQFNRAVTTLIKLQKVKHSRKS